LTVPFIDLTRDHAELRDELLQAVAGVLDTGRATLGPIVDRFERAFAEYCGAGHAVGVAAGTDALRLALTAAGVGPGDEVITAANTCVPTVAAIDAAGARPVLVNPDPDTFTLDPAELQRAATAKTKAIVPVHLYGQCADMDPIIEFARAHELTVIEDACQAHGAEYNGRRAGSLADAAAFSFYPTKNLGALGDGGVIVTNDGALASRARKLRQYGEAERGESVYRHGITSRLDALQAAALEVKLGRLDDWNSRRRELAERYRTALADTGVVMPVEAPGRRHVYHLFVVRVANRDQFQTGLRERGVETLIHYPRAIHEHPGYTELAGVSGQLAASERLAREIVSLPLYPGLTDAEADAVIDAVSASS
jgi:dTDP-4-amino-4,6-dideoxygalactose transaminase